MWKIWTRSIKSKTLKIFLTSVSLYFGWHKLTISILNIVSSRDVFKENYSHFYFRLKEIRIFYNFYPKYDVQNPNPLFFLRRFKNNVKTTDFCLAHMLTYIDFPDSLVGLAYSRLPFNHKGAIFIYLIKNSDMSSIVHFLIK